MRCILERVPARELKRVKELNLTWRVFSTPTTFVIARTHSIQVALIRFFEYQTRKISRSNRGVILVGQKKKKKEREKKSN